MPSSLRIGPIGEFGPPMQRGPVVEKQHIAALELKSMLQLTVFGRVLQIVDRFPLKICERWNLAACIGTINQDPQKAGRKKTLTK